MIRGDPQKNDLDILGENNKFSYKKLIKNHIASFYKPSYCVLYTNFHLAFKNIERTWKLCNL